MLIDDIITLVNPYILSIEYGGSYINPYIKNPKDNDIILVVKDLDTRNELIKTIYSNFTRQQMRENNIDLKIRVFPNDLSEYVYWYLGHFHTPFEGYAKQTTDDFDIEVVKKSLINYINNCKKYKVDIYKEKPVYHVYASICILKHNSYDLTEEEINNINILHDRKEEDFELRKQLIDEMLEEISSWQQM